MNAKNELVPSREIVRVPAALLKVDTTNYRRSYAAEALSELAESIYEEGIIQNLECGPDGTVHLGNRRIAALQTMVIPRLSREIAALEEFEGQANFAELAGVEDPESRLADLRARMADRMLAPVRVLSAEEVKDAKIRQIVENLQREGVSARDEAEGYARLLEERDAEGRAKWTTESIAKRIGKGLSAQYVANRLKLLRAPKEALDALDGGAITVRTAEMIGRVPNEETRKELTGRILKPRFSDRPLTEKEAGDLIRTEYMVSLQKATFDREDLSLVPEAGGCAGCPHRSGNDPSIAAELVQVKGGSVKGERGGMGGAKAGVSPDLCTNPACFRAKCDAAWLRMAAKAEAEGFDVLPEAEEKKVFPYQDGRLPYNSPWIDLDDKPDYEWTGKVETKGTPKWRAVLKDSGIRVTKARNPWNGRVHDLVRSSAAKEAVRLILERAKAAPAEAEVARSGKPVQTELFEGMAKKANRDAEAKNEAARARREARIAQVMAIAGADAILDAMTKPAEGPLDREMMLAVLEKSLGDTADRCAFVALWLELERPHAGASGRDYLPSIMAHVKERDPAYTERELFALIAFATIAGDLKWQGLKGSDVKRYAKLCGADLDAAGKAARAEYLRKERETKKGKEKKEKTADGGEAESRPPVSREEMSLLGPDNPNAALNERRLIALEIAIQTHIELKVAKSFLQKPGPGLGATSDEHGEKLWKELVSRGVIDDEGNVLEIPNWRKDAVGNRRANDFYEARLAAGEEISIPAVERRFGLKDKALATYRKNQNRGKGGE